MSLSFKAIWNYKCPRCREGQMFVQPFEIGNPLNMNEQCEVCNQKFEPEPGFYFGAMFISYILSAWFLLIPTLILVLIYDWSVGSAMGITLLLAAVTYFKFLRGSRALWLHINVKHNKNWKEKT